MEPSLGPTPAYKVPFEPVKEVFLKHLTFKTVFLLAWGFPANVGKRSMLGSTKASDTRQTYPRCLYPSLSFLLSKKELATEGPDSVSAVVIPALTPTLDKSLNADRSLFPVRALPYYFPQYFPQYAWFSNHITGKLPMGPADYVPRSLLLFLLVQS